MSNATPAPGAKATSSSRSGSADKPPSMDELEARIAASRESLAATIDELTSKATPQAIIKRQTEALRTSFQQATHTPDGELRVDRVAALAAAGVLLVALGLWRRAHHD